MTDERYVRGRTVEHVVSNLSTPSPWLHMWCGLIMHEARTQMTDEPVLDVCATCTSARDAFMRRHHEPVPDTGAES